MDTGIAARAAIKRFQTCEPEARAAVRAFHAGLDQPNAALVLFFCSSEYDLEALADEMRTQFGEVRVVGCTTAGEIGPAGYRTLSLTGASFPAADFRVATGRIGNLEGFEIGQGQSFAKELLSKLEACAPHADDTNTFACC